MKTQYWTAGLAVFFWIAAALFACAPLIVPVVVVLTMTGAWK